MALTARDWVIKDEAHSFSDASTYTSILSTIATASNSTSANLVYHWNEDNLEPREPARWLDWSLDTVRSRAWA